MERRRGIGYVLKAARVTGRMLLVLVAGLLTTGFALCGEHRVDRLIDTQTALTLHRTFDLPLLCFLLVHALTSGYLAIRRWGWVTR